MIKPWMSEWYELRDKATIFYIGWLSISREANPFNSQPELDFHYESRILTINLQFPPWKKRLKHPTLGLSMNISLREPHF